MLDHSALTQMYPLIVTPSHDGKYFHNYVTSLLNLTEHAHAVGLRFQVLMQRGESLITRARNNAVADFMANPTWTHLCWIDSDIGFEPNAFFRLLLSDYEIAAGVYPLKHEQFPSHIFPEMSRQQFESASTRYTINIDKTDENNQVNLNILPNGFLEMGEAPTGFMSIKRSVFEKMMAFYPTLKYVPDSIGVEDNGFHYRLFDVMVEPESRRYLSEDYGFCYLWRQMGGKIYIDCQSNLSHQGIKLYTGNFAHSLKHNLCNAIGAPVGAEMRLNGMEYLNN
ncbi:hypothetical protein [Testudinibacter sp. TR-2022]|uniref:hypothetical protein n=1 Tax=Testudinibacter sp. TR-2022 TaxID=2585029 RepID=UPI00111993DE|nr:hypothetical protein [Testudinibacter sp. TR-2022]TNH22348.1 hypothetical protein FHQ27_12625 [Testudinibacter sp. TR-2022]TNH24046.1 hypothetical protein FHQ29_04400 [Testudinibacter sp. TR-2022]